MNHLVLDISKILPNSFQLASQVVKASKEHDVHIQRQQQKAQNKKKPARIPRRWKNKPPAPSNLCYDLTLRSGRTLSKNTYPKHGDKTNITCYECGTKGHYSNKCPMKLNADPVITKASTNPNGPEDPTNIPSSLGGNPVCTTNVYARNPIIIEDSVKGLYSLNICRWRR
jgi:RNase P subunit RPR2